MAIAKLKLGKCKLIFQMASLLNFINGKKVTKLNFRMSKYISDCSFDMLRYNSINLIFLRIGFVRFKNN